MLAKVLSGTTVGLEGVLIEVEVDVAGRGFPSFTIVGLPNKAIDEAKDRVRTALMNTACDMPDSRLTINLAPADIPKTGSAYDLPIAVGILAASGALDMQSIEKSLFIGELSLEGTVRSVPGILSIVMMAQQKKVEKVYVPCENAEEAALIKGITIYPVQSLAALLLHLRESVLLSSQLETTSPRVLSSAWGDFADIKGQDSVKRALEIAAAGFHNIHLNGVPGAGKTLLSRTFPSILPLLTYKEAIEVTKIYSIAGLLHHNSLIWEPPFRAPHHSTSQVGLIGGGSIPGPGEITLAHKGVLFLDEFPEFSRGSIESLRQPLEDGTIGIVRAAGKLHFPAKFLLLAASNPCPCGYLGHPTKSCHCTSTLILRYQKKLSGPIMDRIDLHVHVPPVDHEKLLNSGLSETSETIQARVREARERQRHRFKDTVLMTNSEMSVSDIRNYVRLSEGAVSLLKQALHKLSLSARSYNKVIKVAQTITDLSKKEEVSVNAVAEALQYRPREE